MKQRTFDFTEPQLARLAAEAERSGQGQAEIVRAALEMLFASRFTPYPTSRATSTTVPSRAAGHQPSHQHGHQPSSGRGEGSLGGGTEQVEQQQEQESFSPDVPPPPPERRSKPRKPGELPGFAEFWAAYPRKKSRGEAVKAWSQMAPVLPPLPELLAAVDRDRRSEQWQRDGFRFVPYPASWLRAMCWLDGVDSTTPATLPPRQDTAADAVTRVLTLLDQGMRRRGQAWEQAYLDRMTGHYDDLAFLLTLEGELTDERDHDARADATKRGGGAGGAGGGAARSASAGGGSVAPPPRGLLASQARLDLRGDAGAGGGLGRANPDGLAGGSGAYLWT